MVSAKCLAQKPGAGVFVTEENTVDMPVTLWSTVKAAGRHVDHSGNPGYGTFPQGGAWPRGSWSSSGNYALRMGAWSTPVLWSKLVHGDPPPCRGRECPAPLARGDAFSDRNTFICWYVCFPREEDFFFFKPCLICS